MNLILVGFVLLVALIIFTKIKEIRHHLFYKALAAIVVVFIGSIIYVWLSSGINVSSYDELLGLGKTYFSWLGSLFNNIGGVGGYAVKQNWGINSSVVP
ncbi:hypothetical protein J4229_02560 [Candidatus Pacearchaeota archaeon]|nr:hypothetical protein [Candidatus Pacearchaeota archaeon]